MNNPYLQEIAAKEKSATGNPYLDEIAAKERPIAAGTSKAPLPGRLLSGNLPPSPDRQPQLQPGNPNSNFDPFGQGGGVRTEGTKQPVSKQQVQQRGTGDLRRLDQPPLTGPTSQDVIQGLGPKPFAQAPKPPPAQKPVPQGQEVNTAVKNATTYAKEGPKVAPKAKPPLAQGTFRLPIFGRVSWRQSGVGYEADFPVVGTIKGGSIADLVKNAHIAYEQIKTTMAGPNFAAYEPSMDKMQPPNVQQSGIRTERLLTDAQLKEEILAKPLENVAKTLSPLTMPQRIAEAMGAPKFNGAEGVKGLLDVPAIIGANLVADTIALPMDTASVIRDPDATWQDKLGASANLFLAAATAGTAPGGKSALDEALRWIGSKFDNGEKFAKALDGLPLKPQEKQTVRKFFEESQTLDPPPVPKATTKQASEQGASSFKGKELWEMTRKEAQSSKIKFSDLSRQEQYDLAENILDGPQKDELFDLTGGYPERLVNSLQDTWIERISKSPEEWRREFNQGRRTSEQVVKQYADMPASTSPRIISRGGKFFDGGHRVEAAILRGDKSIESLDIPDIDWVRWYDGEDIPGLAEGDNWHRVTVERALAEGKKVPESVLADYPDIASKYKAKPVEKAPVETPKPPIQETSVKPKVEPPKEDLTGIAKQVTGRTPGKGVTREQLNKLGQEAIAKDANVVSRAVEESRKTGRVMDKTELSASAVRLRQIANRESEIRGLMEKGGDAPNLQSLLDEEAALGLERENILAATDYTLNKSFHEAGMAAQLVHKPDFSLGMLKSRAKASLLGTAKDLPKNVEEKIAGFSQTIDALNAELSKARGEIARLTKSGPKRGTREANVLRLKTYFAQNAGQVAPLVGKTTKKAGAIYTLPDETRDAMRAMRSLAKQLAEDGAEGLDEIVDGIRKEVGASIPDETIYAMLSDRYRNYLLEANVKRIEADRYLREIQRASLVKLKSPVQKAFLAAKDILGTASRSMQAGFDISAPFIQGRKGLIANPAGWLKSWGSQVKALKSGDKVALKRLEEMKQHPLWSRAQAAGLDKVLRVPGGKFSAQEEMFASNFMRLASEWMDKGGKIGKYNPVNLYLKGLQNSDAAFSAFMNDLTWDTFVKWARANPDDPAYLRDQVQNLAIIFGRGHGKVAEAIGRSGAGDVFFAPRYTLSQFQYAGTPIRALYAYETAAGRAQALKTYGAQAAVYTTLVAMARLAGLEVDTDVRSSTFGTVKVGDKRVDLFGKEAQAYKLAGQMMFGNVNKENKYTKPNVFNAMKSGGMFIKNKLAPLPRLPGDVYFGAYDPDEGQRAYGWADFAKRYSPMWVQQALENKSLGTVPFLVTGMDIQKNKPIDPNQKAKKYPLETPKIGKSAGSK